jgi:hypothetical protein
MRPSKDQKSHVQEEEVFWLLVGIIFEISGNLFRIKRTNQDEKNQIWHKTQ